MSASHANAKFNIRNTNNIFVEILNDKIIGFSSVLCFYSVKYIN